MPYEYPKNYARFYDLIYHRQREGIDNEFFLNEIKQTEGKILEIGVGTGRLFCDALRQGADIYGVDISQSMMDVLYKKLGRNQHQRIWLQNIIDFKLHIKFDLIIAPFHVMMHILGKDEQLKAINNVYKHLTTNGRSIFNVFVPDLNQLISGIYNRVDFEDEYNPGKRIKRTVSTKPDLINQLIHITFLLEWNEDHEIKHEEWTFPLRYFFRYELEHLMERSQFEKYKIIGDYLGNELKQNSKEFILICQKQ